MDAMKHLDTKKAHSTFRLSDLWNSTKKTDQLKELSEAYFKVHGITFSFSILELHLVLQNPYPIFRGKIPKGEANRYLNSLYKKHSDVHKTKTEEILQQARIIALVELIWSQQNQEGYQQSHELIQFDDHHGTIRANKPFYISLTQKFIKMINKIENQELQSKFKIMLFKKDHNYYICFHYKDYSLASYSFGGTRADKPKNKSVKQIVFEAANPWVKTEREAIPLFEELCNLVKNNSMLYNPPKGEGILKIYNYMGKVLTLIPEGDPEDNIAMCYVEYSAKDGQMLILNLSAVNNNLTPRSNLGQIQPNESYQTPRDELFTNRTSVTAGSNDSLTDLMEFTPPTTSILAILSGESDQGSEKQYSPGRDQADDDSSSQGRSSLKESFFKVPLKPQRSLQDELNLSIISTIDNMLPIKSRSDQSETRLTSNKSDNTFTTLDLSDTVPPRALKALNKSTDSSINSITKDIPDKENAKPMREMPSAPARKLSNSDNMLPSMSRSDQPENRITNDNVLVDTFTSIDLSDKVQQRNLKVFNKSFHSATTPRTIAISGKENAKPIKEIPPVPERNLHPQRSAPISSQKKSNSVNNTEPHPVLNNQKEENKDTSTTQIRHNAKYSSLSGLTRFVVKTIFPEKQVKPVKEAKK